MKASSCVTQRSQALGVLTPAERIKLVPVVLGQYHHGSREYRKGTYVLLTCVSNRRQNKVDYIVICLHLYTLVLAQS